MQPLMRRSYSEAIATFIRASLVPMADVSISLPAKRKRGRPRKDVNAFRQSSLQPPETLTLVKPQHAEVAYPAAVGAAKVQASDNISKDSIVNGMVGSMIYGVVEGSFDAGYLISVRIGNNDIPFRGVVFQPSKFVPITATNDIAPQAKMYHRKDLPIPAYNDLSGINPQPEKVALQPVQASKSEALCPILTSMSPSVTPYSVENHSTFMAPDSMMRTGSCSNMGGTMAIPKSPVIGINQQSPSVQEVMQAFEGSQSSKDSKNNMLAMGNLISESSLRAMDSSFCGKESITQRSLVHEKNVEVRPGQSFLAHTGQNSSNLELHLDSTESMPQSAFGIQQDDMRCHDIPAVSQGHSVPQEIESTKTELLPTNLYYNGLRTTNVNFPQYLLTDQSQPDPGEFHSGDFVDRVSRSPNLKLDLSSAIQENKLLQPETQTTTQICIETNYLALNGLKNPSVGYHQALVSGNPLLLPPDIVGPTPDFELGKLKSPSENRTLQETNLESRFARTGEDFGSPGGAGGSMTNTEADPAASSPYKLELSVPQSSLNLSAGKPMDPSAGCMTTYMNFVLSDVAQGNPSDVSETKQR